MTTNKHLGLGSLLATVGALGILLSLVFDWTNMTSPWDFLLGFAFGLAAGSGTALAVYGLIRHRPRP